MRSNQFIIIELIIAVLVIAVLLAVSIPRFIKAQRITSHHPDYTKGTLVKTDDPFDIAISGKGYFCLMRTDGVVVYSRHSELTLDETGRLTSVYGFELADNIVFPQQATHYDISIDGIVSVVQQPGNQTVQIGQIQLASFINPDGLLMDENGCYVETEESGPPVHGNPNQNELGMLLQGYQLKSRFDPGTPEHLIINGEYYSGYDDNFQEPLIHTDRPMDYAINGPGWAVVTLPDGSMGFTRRLSISKDETGRLVIEWSRTQSTLWGVPILLYEDEEYQKRKSELMSQLSQNSSTASILANVEDVVETQSISDAEIHEKLNQLHNEHENNRIMYPLSPDELKTKIQLYRFASPEKLHYVYKGIYAETDASGPAIPVKPISKNAGTIQSGYLNDVPRSEP